MYLTWLSCGICTSFIWTDGHVSRHVVDVTWTDLVSLALIRQVFSQDWIARRVVWSFSEAVAGSLSVVTTAVVGKGGCDGARRGNNLWYVRYTEFSPRGRYRRKILLHVGPLLGNDGEISNYATAIPRQFFSQEDPIYLQSVIFYLSIYIYIKM
jgi:hypothetical protein